MHKLAPCYTREFAKMPDSVGGGLAPAAFTTFGDHYVGARIARPLDPPVASRLLLSLCAYRYIIIRAMQKTVPK